MNQRDALDVVHHASPPCLGQGTSKSCPFIPNYRSNTYTGHTRGTSRPSKPMIWAAQGTKESML